MDKNTLSNYGWIVTCVLVLAVMIALATPFGTYVKDAVWSTTEGLFDVSENALGVLGIDLVDDTADDIGTVGSDKTITLRGSKVADGTYTLKYENNGTPLTGYADICSLTITDGADASYTSLIAENCAPVGATVIGVYDSTDARVGEISLGSLKTKLGTKLYSFGAISDVHIGYETAESDFQTALAYLSNTEKVSFIAIAGDLTSSGSDAQLNTYKNTVSSYATVPVYAITGNHDTESYRGSDVSSIISNYTEKPLYYSFTQGNDVFIMLGLKTDVGGSILADGELQWLYETLESNKDKRCFVFTHVYTNSSSGDPENIYGYDLWQGTEEKVFMSLLKHYPNITLFHGHSHIEFALQSISDTAIIETNSGYNSIHIPSITAPRTGTVDGGNILSNYLYDESEGYVIDVYNNGIVLRGRDFVDGKFLPIAQYYIPTAKSSVAAGTYTDSTGTIDPSTMFEGHTITYKLSNATSSNATSEVIDGNSFKTSILTEWGYFIEKVSITMGGKDITSSVVNGNNIIIPSVTDNVVISVTTRYEMINLIDDAGYTDNMRLSQSSGELKAQVDYTTTGFIELEPGAVYRTSGINFNDANATDYFRSLIMLYDSDKESWTTTLVTDSTTTFPVIGPTQTTRVVTIDCDDDGNLTFTIAEDLFTNPNMNQGRYIRICSYGSGKNLIVTKNQEIN